MDIKLEYDISIDEYIEVINLMGWKIYSKEQTKKALDNTIYKVKAIVDGKLAGIGRVVGDGSISYMLTDICVKREFQGNGIGLKIVNELKRLLENGLKEGEGARIELSPTAGKERFYEKAGFIYKPNEVTGMFLNIQKQIQ